MQIKFHTYILSLLATLVMRKQRKTEIELAAVLHKLHYVPLEILQRLN